MAGRWKELSLLSKLVTVIGLVLILPLLIIVAVSWLVITVISRAYWLLTGELL